MLSGNNKIKLEINWKKISGKTANTWRLNNIILKINGLNKR